MQRKTIISWLGFRDDFEQGMVNRNSFEQDTAKRTDFDPTIVNPEGPNPSLHLHHWNSGKNFDRHLLLHLNKPDSLEKAQTLKDWLETQGWGDRMELVPVNLDERDLINLSRIQNKLTTLLMDYREDELYFFVTPGTKAMHTAWHIEHQNGGWNSTLIQVRPGRHTPDQQPEWLTIDLVDNGGPFAAIEYEEELRNPQFDGDIFIPDALTKAYALAEKVAATDKVSALILGSSGTGKEVLAGYILNRSARKDMPFQPVNCSSLPDDLLYSELFGHKKGAFTGAHADRIGLFRAAQGGTVFLDEIGDISPKMQQSLLRVLQEQKVKPAGEDQEYEVDVRVIAATNRDLRKACEKGDFRWDLYYRLAVVEIQLPDLWEWGAQDIRTLLEKTIRRKQPIRPNFALRLTASAQKALVRYSFPGNVRELENLVARLYVTAEAAVEVADLPPYILDEKQQSPLQLSLLLAEVEEAHIRKVLRANRFNKERSAATLGIDPRTLNKRIRHFRIEKNICNLTESKYH